MRFEYQPSLVEQAVFLAARRDPHLECELHSNIDPVYLIPDDELRERDAQRLYTDFFTRIGLDRPIAGLIAERPTIVQGVELCVVREAGRARAQSAELFVRRQDGANEPPMYTLVVKACAESLLDPTHLESWLRCELLAVSDMLDPAFEYSPELPEDSPSRQALIRDRYSVLWGIYVEARLLREGRAHDSRIPNLWKSFSRAMVQDGLRPPRSTFDALLETNHVTHGQLLAWASDPAGLGGTRGRNVDHGLTLACNSRILGSSVKEM